jgi:hypothetical protein
MKALLNSAVNCVDLKRIRLSSVEKRKICAIRLRRATAIYAFYETMSMIFTLKVTHFFSDDEESNETA